MVVATKGRFPMGAGPNDLGLSRRHLGDALDASLRRLGIEQIDLYQMHAWDALTPLEETLRFLDDAIARRQDRLLRLLELPRLAHHQGGAPRPGAAGWAPPVTLQPQYNLLVRDIEHEIVPACLDAGIGLLPWSPLAGGWLAGKYQRDVPPTGATRLGENPDARHGGLRAAQRRASAPGASSTRSPRWPRPAASAPAEVALAWLAAAARR